MAYQVSLASARSKFERMEMHRNALDHNLGEIVVQKANRVPVYAEMDPDSGFHIFRIQSVVENGTAPHRSRPHHRRHGSQPPRRPRPHLLAARLLPLRRHSPEPQARPVPHQRQPRNFSRLDVRADVLPGHWDIIEKHQPHDRLTHFPEDAWSGPYVHQLAMLRDLSNHDKHRITTPVLEIPNSVHLPGGLGVVYETFPETLTGQGFPVTFSMDNASDVVEVGAPVGRALLSGPGAKPKIDNAGEVAPGITLTEGRPIVETLDRISGRVDLILGEFEALFPS